MQATMIACHIFLDAGKKIWGFWVTWLLIAITGAKVTAWPCFLKPDSHGPMWWDTGVSYLGDGLGYKTLRLWIPWSYVGIAGKKAQPPLQSERQYFYHLGIQVHCQDGTISAFQGHYRSILWRQSWENWLMISLFIQ